MTATNQPKSLERLAAGLVDSIWPSETEVYDSVQRFRLGRPELEGRELADRWAEGVCRRYAAEGALTALPAVVPGLGTSTQLALEGGTIAADLAYMLRCMARIVLGVSQAFELDIDRPFKHEFVRILGLWCGTVSLGREAAIRVGTKVAVAQAKRVPAELLGRFHQRLLERALTRVGVSRGSASLGRLLPFGVGVLVGGGFNYATMRRFKRTTVDHYASWGTLGYPKTSP